MPQPGAPNGPVGDDSADVPLLETVAQNVPIVLFALDPDGTFTRSEGRGLQALGLEPDEVVGQSVFDVYADHPDVLRSVERALDGQNVNSVIEIGDAVFETWYRPIYDGGVERVIGVAVDVTDRTRHERLLARLNEANRELMVAESAEGLADRIVDIARRVLDEPASVVWFYDADERVLAPIAGTNEETARHGPGRPFWELDPIQPGTAEMAAFRDGESVFFEDYASVADRAHPGTAFGAILAVPIGDRGLLTVGAAEAGDMESSTPDLVEILARDAAVAIERVEREAALEHLHAATRALMSATSREAIARRTVDTAADVLGHPKAVVRFLTPDGERLEPVASSAWIRAHVGPRSSFRPGEGVIGTTYARGEVMRFDRRDATELELEPETQAVLCLPLGEHGVLSIGESEQSGFSDSDVQLAGILASNVETALDRIDRERELERRNERLDQFAEIVSHDLRNPLNVIAGHVELAEVAEPHRNAIEEATERMRGIIDEVLELARQGHVVVDPAPTEVMAVARHAWASVQTEEATVELGDGLTVLADEDRLQRLFENLFRNAVEHGPGDVRVRVGPLDDGFYVADDGPGIDPADRTSVFDAGFSTIQGSTGLGLAIVAEIAEAHGWTISLDESADDGARFEVTGVTVA